jgi:3'-phosphoadenosine 5'-phosphosulfate sulfotransferase (PAPS reductase)/FAD synthetase
VDMKANGKTQKKEKKIIPLSATSEAFLRMAQAGAVDLTLHDYILVNTSAGKDSLAMLDFVCTLAKEQGVLDRVIAVHCDLGRVEWAGTKELGYQQCLRYGIPMHVVKRELGDLLRHVEERGKWPGASTRFCTSDHKTAQVKKLMTQLVDQFIEEHCLGNVNRPTRRVRILNCLGLRAAESPKRADMDPISQDPASNPTKKDVTRWLPIHGWSDAQVWSLIRSKGLPYHKAYDLGMPRLSCVFCFYAPAEALKLAGYHNPELLNEYVRVEEKIRHDFKHKEPLVQIQAALQAGYVPSSKVDASLWSQCA